MKCFFDSCSYKLKKVVREYVDGNGNHYSMNEFVNNPDVCDYKGNRQCHLDIYGILAWMNGCENLKYYGENKPTTMYEILKNGFTWDDDARHAGIDIGCYDNQVDILKYPLKLVSASYRGDYENCKGRSYGDPEQGFGAHTWEQHIWYGRSYEDYFEKLIELENE